MREFLDSIDDEDDEGGGSGGRLATAHEALTEDVAIPDIVEVDPEETLERVGEILSIMQDRVVIVKGLVSQVAGHALDRVLDTDTLLVFEDRKVLGYVSSSSHLFPVVSFFVPDTLITPQIHETFGPTHQPLYQVRFNDKFPLDKERAQTSRSIFHVPGRSNFVFVDKLKLTKGSDASNAHDEEPGEDEVEFSDDEREAAYKRMLKERFFLPFDFPSPGSHQIYLLGVQVPARPHAHRPPVPPREKITTISATHSGEATTPTTSTVLMI